MTRYHRNHRCPACQRLTRGTSHVLDARYRRWHVRCARQALAALPAKVGRPPKAVSAPRVPRGAQQTLPVFVTSQ